MNTDELTQLVKQFSKDKDRSLKRIELLKSVVDKMSSAFDELYPDMRKPIVAGGAIRDIILGTAYIRDFDFFIDCEKQGEDPDEVLLLVLDKLSTEGFIPAFLVGNAYQGEDINPTWTICDLLTPHSYTIEMISRPDSDDLETLIGGFDYSLVRAGYDLETKKWYFDKSLVESLRTKKILCESKKTFARVNRWLDRDYTLMGKFRLIRKYLEKSTNIHCEIPLQTGEYHWVKMNQHSTSILHTR